MATSLSNRQGYLAPGPYDEDYRSIARREQLAQILQQQALQPIEAGSYQGIQAPISPLSGIAKVLQGYLAGQQYEEADKIRQDLALKAHNADLSLVGLPPVEKTQQLAKALQQPVESTTWGEGPPPQTVAQALNQTPNAQANPMAQTIPVAQSFPVGPSGAYQNLPPNQGIDAVPQTASIQGSPAQGAPAVPPQGQFRPPGGGPVLPSVTGDPLKDLALLKQFKGDTAAYIKFAYEQNKPQVLPRGSSLVTNQNRLITGTPDEKGNVIVQNPDGTFRIEKAAGASELARGEAFTKEYATEGARATVARDTTHFDLAQAAPQNIEKANRIMDLVDSGALTGTAAEKKLQIARMFNITGSGPEETIKKTELLISALGRAIDPLNIAVTAVTKPARLAEALATPAIGLTTGAGAESIREAARAGAAGGEKAEAFLGQLRRNAPIEDVVNTAKEAVSELRTNRADAYKSSMGGITTDKKVSGMICIPPTAPAFDVVVFLPPPDSCI